MNEVYSYRSSSYHTQKLYRDGDTVYDIELNLTGSLKLVPQTKLFAALLDPRCNFFDCTDTSASMSGNDYTLAQTRETSPPTLSCFLREASIV